MKKFFLFAAIAVACVGSFAISKRAKASGDYPGGNCYLNIGGESCPSSSLANCTCIK